MTREEEIATPQNREADMPDVVWKKISKADNGCWNWIGAKEKTGYGKLSIKCKSIYAHRYIYELLRKKIPSGLVIDHLCRNKSCVNPDHLEIVNQRENVMRGRAITADNAKKDRCANGHILSGDNIKIVKRKDGERRKCKTCDREYKRAKRDVLKPERIKRPYKLLENRNAKR